MTDRLNERSAVSPPGPPKIYSPENVARNSLSGTSAVGVTASVAFERGQAIFTCDPRTAVLLRAYIVHWTA
jgi:hypothetical protein